MAAVVALDIGGSGIRAARVEDGEIVRRERLGLIPGAMAAQAAETLRAALCALDLSPADSALGVAFPGFLDGAGRVLPGIYLPGMVGMDFVDTLGPLMAGRPVAVVPDVAAAALAEAGARHLSGRLCVSVSALAPMLHWWPTARSSTWPEGASETPATSWSTLTARCAPAAGEDASRRCAPVGVLA